MRDKKQKQKGKKNKFRNENEKNNYIIKWYSGIVKIQNRELGISR